MAVLRLPSGAGIGKVALRDDRRAVELPQPHRAVGVLEQEVGVPVRGEVIDRDELPSRAWILQPRLGDGRRAVHQPDARRAVVVLPGDLGLAVELARAYRVPGRIPDGDRLARADA